MNAAANAAQGLVHDIALLESQRDDLLRENATLRADLEMMTQRCADLSAERDAARREASAHRINAIRLCERWSAVRSQFLSSMVNNVDQLDEAMLEGYRRAPVNNELRNTLVARIEQEMTPQLEDQRGE